MPCPPAPGLLGGYVAQLDGLLPNVAQRRALRDYLHGLLLPRERNKTLTGLAGTEPVVGAQAPPAQRLQWFLSESAWDAAALNDRRLELLIADPTTRPHDRGILIIDETGDRKDGTKTAHVAHQYLGSVGRIADGIVSVTSLWADEDVYYPLHVAPYTPARRLAKGKDDPAFRAKPQLAVALIDAAVEAGFAFRAVVADCLYGEHPAVQTAPWDRAIPYVMALRAHRGSWAPADDPHTPEDAARVVPWESPRTPGGWTTVVRRFRDGHRATWWAADLRLAGMAPDKALRLVAVTTDPARLPADSTWYLLTNLPHPDAPHAATSPFTPATLAEIARLYGLRAWVEQGDKQMKQEPGWADRQVRSDRAIRRHWTLVCCAFAFCWWAWSRAPDDNAVPTGTADGDQPVPVANPGRGKNVADDRAACRPTERLVAGGAAAGPFRAAPLDPALALVARLVAAAPATAVTGAP
ncbi:MAG TPA: IS701 family transposase [Thermomicrobiales bacterium]